ncbi:MAG TPA: tRNA lysidine(34) synthetase TilS [Acidobacteria bacterium]|nr:tRNA lysidine(34) synthetase TilS [Acidobacteriota bacterium]
MEALAGRVLAAVRQQALIPRGGRVLVALSGGGDSVALLCLMAELARHSELSLVGIAHVNHQLRVPASDEDADFCRALAAQFELPCVVETVDVAMLARQEHISVEHAGHQARHQCFDRVAEQFGATEVALGHTLDDQAETYLLRLFRGAGAAGLSAMRPRLGRVVRPLLTIRRAELRAYLTSRQISFLEDPSNLDRQVPRNRVRHDLLPNMERYAPGVVERIARSAEIARADEEWLGLAASEAAVSIVKRIKSGVEVEAGRFASLPLALARRVAKDLLSQVSRKAVGFDQIERFRALAVGGPMRIDFPGCRAERTRGMVRLVTRRGRGVPTGSERFQYRLEVPGEVAVPEAKLVLSADLVGKDSVKLRPSQENGLPLEQAVSADVAAGPLVVRCWRPGDRFRPLGLEGHHKKLQDLFVDRKVRQDERSRVPVVLDGTGRVVWVVGLGLGDDFRVTEATASVLILRVRSLGDKL